MKPHKHPKRIKVWTRVILRPKPPKPFKFVVALAEPHHGSASFSKLHKPTSEEKFLCLPQLRVLRFRLLQDRNIRVRVLPQRKEILIGRLGLDGVALQHISATEA